MSGSQEILPFPPGGVRRGWVAPVPVKLGETDLAGVGPALAIADRAFPGGPVRCASVVGLWSCTRSTFDAGDWFRRKVRTLGLVEDGDFAWVDVCDGRRELFVDLMKVGNVMRNMGGPCGVEAARLAAEAVRELAREVRGAMAAIVGGGGDGGGGGAGGDGVPDRDGSEQAYDFERLVPVVEREIGGRRVLSVVARDLWTFLGSGWKFAAWVPEQARHCRLREGVDYVQGVFPEIRKNVVGRRRKEFVLTLDAAKEVGMVDKGDRGKMLRHYFLECERRAEAASGSSLADLLSAGGARAVSDWLAGPGLRVPDTVPLTMRDYLLLAGVPRDQVRLRARREEADLLDLVLSRGIAGGAARHPLTGRLVFRREVLDAWCEARPSGRDGLVVPFGPGRPG